MSEQQQDVKVFISWSGDLARAIAGALREWLPLLFDRIEPWVSDTDIAAGQRGLAQIETELSETKFGIVVVTPDNQNAPWINFEAGALSRTVRGDIEQRVVPLLVGIGGPTQLTGPLSQFQAKVADRNGMMSLLRSLAAVAGIDERVADARFEVYWPSLETKFATATKNLPGVQSIQRPRAQADILDEILLHVRTLRSEAEVTSSTSRKPTAVGRRSVRQILQDVANEYDLNLFEYERPSDGPREVTVSPRGEYSQHNVDLFEQALRERFPFDTVVHSIPF